MMQAVKRSRHVRSPSADENNGGKRSLLQLFLFTLCLIPLTPFYPQWNTSYQPKESVSVLWVKEESYAAFLRMESEGSRKFQVHKQEKDQLPETLNCGDSSLVAISYENLRVTQVIKIVLSSSQVSVALKFNYRNKQLFVIQT